MNIKKKDVVENIKTKIILNVKPSYELLADFIWIKLNHCNHQIKKNNL